MRQTQESIENILNNAFQISLLPIHLFYEKKYLVSCCQSDSYNLPPSFVNIEFLDPKTDNPRNLIWFDSTFKEVFYGHLYICSSYSCLIGPCSTCTLSFMNRQKYAQAHHVESIQIPECSVYKVKALLQLLSSAFQIPDESPTILLEESTIHDAVSSDISVYKMQQYQLDHSEQGFLHHTYQLEQDLRRCFLEIDEETFSNYLSSNVYETRGTMSHNPVKQEEYTAVISVGLYVRYAIEAGMEQFQAYNLADLYLQKISNLTSIAAYRAIIVEAGHRFMSEVKRARGFAGQCQHVEKCKQYIYKNLNKPFSLENIAEYVGLTPTYLSGLFSKYENTSIKEYILRRRIEASKNMLKYSDYSISQIAYYFCFSSQSHYTNIFKKYAEQTPSAFRRANKQI